jgi:hypothetical protein
MLLVEETCDCVVNEKLIKTCPLLIPSSNYINVSRAGNDHNDYKGC